MWGGVELWRRERNIESVGLDDVAGPTLTGAGSRPRQDATAFAQVSLTVCSVHSFSE